MGEATWIERRAVADPAAVDLLRAELDAGEAEAIVLARQLRARYVILDNREPRIVARRLGLTVIGTVGVLVECKRRGLIENCRTVLSELVAEGFWLSPDVVAAAVRAAGE